MTKWIDKHLETFVRPHLGYIPSLKKHYLCTTLFDEDVVKILLRAWELARVKAKDSPILLPGRDVTLLHVIAGMKGHKHRFLPEMSTNVSANIWQEGKKPYKGHYVVDTGFAGSVAKNLHCRFGLISGTHRLRVTTSDRQEDIANLLENSPKYWNTAEYGEKQTLRPKARFEQAAVLTRHVAAIVRTL